HLSLLQRLLPSNQPVFAPDLAGLPQAERTTAQQLARRFEARRDPWVKSVYQLLDAVRQFPRGPSFANVPTPGGVHRCDWEAGPRRWFYPFLIVFALLAIVLLVALVWSVWFTCQS